MRVEGVSIMDEILSVNTLQESLHRRIRSDRVRVREENGVIMLTPVVERTAPPKNSREALFGCMRGQFKMADDFDAPLEDFKEYMG